MKHINGVDISIHKKTAVTVGNFDGLHLGHSKLIAEVKQKALVENLTSVVFSFSPHPISVLRNMPDMPLILSPEEKLNLLDEMGVDVYIEYPFTKEFAGLEPEHFIKEIIVNKLNAKALVIGDGYKFGKNQGGDCALARELGKESGLEVISIPHISDHGTKISSSIIRRLISEKDFKTSEHYLGRPFFAMGEVMHGKRLGRTMGFPTVNLIPYKNKLLPPDGVYLTRTYYKNHVHNSMTNIGKNPTVAGEIKTIETYLFDFSETIYGEIIRVDFHAWLRGEVKFNSIDELKNQLQMDIESAKQFFRIK